MWASKLNPDFPLLQSAILHFWLVAGIVFRPTQALTTPQLAPGKQIQRPSRTHSLQDDQQQLRLLLLALQAASAVAAAAIHAVLQARIFMHDHRVVVRP